MKNRNSQRFEVRIGPAVIDTEKELLFVRYKAEFKGRLSDSLYSSLGMGRENIIYSSMQTEIRENGKLVAFSIFDCGDAFVACIDVSCTTALSALLFFL